MVTKTSKGASTPITAQQLARHSVLDLGSQEAIVERAKQVGNGLYTVIWRRGVPSKLVLYHELAIA